jgi:hypothetical protein
MNIYCMQRNGTNAEYEREINLLRRNKLLNFIF